MKRLLLSVTILIPLYQGFAQTASYKIDLSQSEIKWTGYYLFSFGEHYGTMKLKSGQLNADNGNIISGTFEIDMNSIKNLDQPAEDGGKALEDHLKSEDFFSTEKFPVALFEILSVKKIENAKPNQPNYDVTGNFKLKGESNPITFPALITVTDNGVLASAKFKFDRTKWKVHYGSGKFFDDVGDGAISDAIGIEFTIKATK